MGTESLKQLIIIISEQLCSTGEPEVSMESDGHAQKEGKGSTGRFLEELTGEKHSSSYPVTLGGVYRLLAGGGTCTHAVCVLAV